ncbi:hypothetical protein [Fructilactobacillus cliffordii]|uniref:Prepilin-type N-terminal cleavage/methylation domain-containing protein n=1 Tax=Fructilactobacillus cliffordii TaxID=2940299 RepID=A0A9Q9E3H0_9LACO|nr:hypothetical protein [Fructilactobacillus cliffordii]USS86786.1 hypothetical protein M3M38_01585 [Fructilactobacillus cliffordii]USS89782.1 hypothetical protein M3M40_03125 [Fructilactobacillus cliffordii]
MPTKSNRQGFTLLESLIVLGLTTLTLVTLSVGVRWFNEANVTETAFWHDFANTWNRTLVLARQNQTPATVTFLPNDQVIFRSYNHGNQFQKRVSLPSGLSPVRWYEVKITDQGYVKPQTLRWLSNASHTEIWQKFQLGWGSYVNEKHKTNS